ncbi:MAG: Rhamnogalacturonate lyase [Candidatus Ordinivivax streblomastigis]|uniref:Rhamnogalacturonate lyase n=1 Tax=Candidatus Ordinivivax streblomastigis TaxID=2540710 RepID=A0A5M8NU61_9BACT|nr:MAG: Rhamnogalacturonate lyase [Candidatus Ordinivivax streblomastigis]
MKILKKIFFTVMLACFAMPVLHAQVALTEDVETYIMDNGIVSVRVSKITGDLVSFRYQGAEMFATTLSPDFHPEAKGDSPANNPNWREPSIGGHAHGYWSHDAMGTKGSAPAIPSVTIDPKTNGGKIAEVSVKAISKDRKMGTGPGTGSDGDLTVDIELRYTLEQGASGVYTYCAFDHNSSYPLAQFGEARYCAKLADFFDWISIDSNVDIHYPKTHNAGDKYVYTALQSTNPAFGWSSTTKNVGLFYINPSMEYMSGGPTKVEFMGHRNTTAEAEPCVLNYWRSSHYGGAEANIAAGEAWNKIIGPFFIYANSGNGHAAIYADAKKRAAIETAKWPYEWVKGVDYPSKSERATVKGQFILDDQGVKSTKFSNLTVGLAHVAYISPRPNSSPEVITNWQRDGKFYQFWAKGNTNGTFEIGKVRPGKYTLYAFTDGVLGEYIKAGVVVEKGKTIDLGKLVWTPVRKGKQVWEIGIPNRNASEFFKADEHRDTEISIKYATLFPNDVNFTIGKSDVKKDWFYQHVPHNEDPNAKSAPFYGVNSPGRATPYTITFDLPSAPKGKAILRLAICGTGTRSVNVTVNEKPAGTFDNLSGDGVITRHGSQGIWYEREIAFDAKMMKKGTNVLVLTVPAGPINNGIVYDYIRLELDETTAMQGIHIQVPPPMEDINKVVDNTIDSFNLLKTVRPVAASSRKGNNPVLFLVGNSTMRTGTRGNGDNGQWGWGFYMDNYFDADKITVENHALGGTSSRSFYNGFWPDVIKGVKAGDWVFIELGHNDNGPYDSGRARASIKGIGKETIEVIIQETGKKETVYSYGEYLRKYIQETKAKGAHPVLFSLTPRNSWKETGKINRVNETFGLWAKQIAEEQSVPFVDLNDITALKYEQFGKYKVNYMFYGDAIHTSAFGAKVNAASAAEGIRSHKDLAQLAQYLKPEKQDGTAGSKRMAGKPVVFTIGDSTVKNKDKDSTDMWGWGSVIGEYFDPNKAVVDNQAMAGRSARTYLDEDRWDRVYNALQPGDIVFIQFGHNDGGEINTGKARGELNGTGEESIVLFMEATHRNQVIYTYGWYIRKFVGDALEKGAIPIVLSHTPRNQWTPEDKVIRNKTTYGIWAKEAARAMGAYFIDLNEISAAKLEKIGKAKATDYFKNDHTHTSLRGAIFNAESVVEGVMGLTDERVKGLLK